MQLFFLKSLDNIFFKHRGEEYLDRDLFFKEKAIYLDGQQSRLVTY